MQFTLILQNEVDDLNFVEKMVGFIWLCCGSELPVNFSKVPNFGKGFRVRLPGQWGKG